MKKYKVVIDADVKGQKDVDKLNESLEETQEEQQGVQEGFSEMGGAADKVTGGMISGMMAVKKSVMTSVRSLGLMKAALIATGIGAFLVIITSIKAAFTSTEAGQNKFNKLMNALGVITGNLIDLFADFGMGIIEAFENPQKALKSFWEALKSNVVVRVQSVIDMFGLLGKAVKQVFEGDWDGAMESAKEAGSKYIDVLTGVEGTLGKVKDGITAVIEETEREIEVSNRLSDLQAKITKETREQLVERAKIEGQIAELRVKALDQENFTAGERARFLSQALEMNDELFAQEEKLAAMRLEVRREQNKLAGSTADDLLLEAQLEADLIRIVKQRADASRELYSQLVGLRKQSAEGLVMLNAKTLETTEATEKDRGDIIAKGAEGRIVIAENTAAAEEQIEKMSAQNTLNAIGGLFGMLADMSEKDFERQKKFRVAEAVVNTISGAVAAFMGGVATIPGPFGLILGGVLAAATLAAGYANVQKIRATTPGSGGGGGGSSSAGGVNASAGGIPRQTVPSQDQINPMTTGEANISKAVGANDKPIKSFVVSDDMTSQQELDRRIETNAAI